MRILIMNIPCTFHRKENTSFKWPEILPIGSASPGPIGKISGHLNDVFSVHSSKKRNVYYYYPHFFKLKLFGFACDTYLIFEPGWRRAPDNLTSSPQSTDGRTCRTSLLGR